MRKIVTISLLAITVLVLRNETGWAQQGKVPEAIWEKSQKTGRVRVIVDLDFPVQPENKLELQTVLAQRESISAFHNQFINELRGTQHKVLGQLITLPMVALEVERAALNILDKSARVLKVTENRPTYLQITDTVSESRCTDSMGPVIRWNWMDV
jgi:hypothetical protein